jgi:hypothetical protein
MVIISLSQGAAGLIIIHFDLQSSKKTHLINIYVLLHCGNFYALVKKGVAKIKFALEQHSSSRSLLLKNSVEFF